MRKIEDVFHEMLACFQEQTGMELNEGCDLAVRLYTLAAQVCALYAQADWVTRQSFPQTAEGEYLDLHAQLRGLERKQGSAAQGKIVFTAGEVSSADRSIPAGTVCMTTGLIRFETTQEVTLPAGARTAEAPIQALAAGTAGNVSAGTIVSMAVAPVGISSCVNPEPCAGGGDQESDEALRERVLDTFRRLPNGANNAFYEQGALSFDQVAAAAVIPRPRGVGTVDVVVSTLAGLPDQPLLDQLTGYFQERREIAVEVQVRAPRTASVNLAVKVEPQPGRDPDQVVQGVRDALQGWFNGKLLGQDVLLAKLGSIVFGCDGVANYAISAPAADLRVESDVLPVLNTLSVEVMA